MTRKYAGRFIVKVQRPLITSGPAEVVLVYNRRRTIHALLPMPRKLLRLIMGDGLKQYCYAYMRGTAIHIDGIAPWQKW